ncbi:hypothetical protein VitviT2T_003204 [Vitis vinifera]|uniref:DUF241 domain protein n=2 Tax=Vitis vinifera TaxID=29760 RepID=A0ABY9BKR7_VITVI|nr:uncharacterized protein LOC100262338 [Vitis vinifera]WJZ83533.1 hypothetical protein VitviT2T_003204 [Vitis vinifera]|eukprot:XP_002281727.1 PREDICTED: uncharacterized protein LOC100262338 [Vitis vinifera]
MAYSPLNLKAQYHVRSISLPSRPHPLIPEFNEHLCRLRASQAASSSSSSSSSISHRLRGLKDLHDSVDDLLLLPLTQQTLAQHRHEKWVDELLDGSLRLLDVCGTAKDALLQTREHSHELQSSLRRRQGGENGIAAEVGEYLTSRKTVKKAMHKALRNLKGMENKSNFSPWNKDPDTISIVTMLKEAETVTLTVLESLLSSIAGVAAKSKPSSWSFVSKLIHHKHVACEEAAGDLSEFEKVDAALCNLISGKTKSLRPVHIDDVQNKIGKLETSIQGLEEGIEFLSRHLIKTRVSILNILSH